MKKTILALLVLLFLLIFTCVYLKTSVLHAKYNKNNSNILLIVSPASLPSTTQKITIKKIQKSLIKKTMLRSRKETEVFPKPEAKQKPSPLPTKKEDQDIEEIDTLMRALKERERAFKNRDKFELHIQELIKRALKNRSTAIAHMNKEELHLLELQKELLKERDLTYDKIGQTNTPITGE